MRKRLLRYILAVVFFILAGVGALLPLLQGWFFLALTLLCLAPDIPALRRLLIKIKRRHPASRKPLRFWEKLLYRK